MRFRASQFNSLFHLFLRSTVVREPGQDNAKVVPRVVVIGVHVHSLFQKGPGSGIITCFAIENPVQIQGLKIMRSRGKQFLAHGPSPRKLVV